MRRKAEKDDWKEVQSTVKMTPENFPSWTTLNTLPLQDIAGFTVYKMHTDFFQTEFEAILSLTFAFTLLMHS